MAKVTRKQLIDCYTWAVIRWGTYSAITLDAVTRDSFGEIVILCDDSLMFQGDPDSFIAYSMANFS